MVCLLSCLLVQTPPPVHNKRADICKGFVPGRSVLCLFVQITPMWNMGYNYESDARGSFTDLSTLSDTLPEIHGIYLSLLLFLCKVVFRM